MIGQKHVHRDAVAAPLSLAAVRVVARMALAMPVALKPALPYVTGRGGGKDDAPVTALFSRGSTPSEHHGSSGPPRRPQM